MATREARSLDKKTQILNAARSVVMDGGFRELQMNAVAAAGGIAVGTIYRYFASRADLCASIVSVTSQRELDVLMAIAGSEGTATEKLHDGVRTFTSRALRGRRLAYGLIFEPIDPAVENARLEYRRAIARVFEGIIRAGMSAREFREVDPQIAATCLVGAFMEGLISALAPDAPAIDKRGELIVQAIADICLASVANADTLASRDRISA